MAGRGRTIVVGAFNIVATPHPAGIYRQALDKAAGTELRVWGPDYAKITAPQEEGAGRLTGVVHLWTRIDKGGRWFNSATEAEAEEADKRKIEIPEYLNPNYRTFRYALLEKSHRILLEYENEHRERFSPQRALRFFSALLTPEVLGEQFPAFAVTIVPDEETLGRIFALPYLRRLDIHLLRPNADDLTAQEILDRLEKMGAKSEERVLVKAAAEPSLKPDGETKAIAEVAAENGYVSGTGTNADGSPEFVSTKDHPKKVTIPIEEHESAYVRFWSASGLF